MYHMEIDGWIDVIFYKRDRRSDFTRPKAVIVCLVKDKDSGNNIYVVWCPPQMYYWLWLVRAYIDRTGCASCTKLSRTIESRYRDRCRAAAALRESKHTRGARQNASVLGQVHTTHPVLPWYVTNLVKIWVVRLHFRVFGIYFGNIHVFQHRSRATYWDEWQPSTRRVQVSIYF